MCFVKKVENAKQNFKELASDFHLLNNDFDILRARHITRQTALKYYLPGICSKSTFKPGMAKVIEIGPNRTPWSKKMEENCGRDFVCLFLSSDLETFLDKMVKKCEKAKFSVFKMFSV
jgi:hypothetical protein